ncbi:PepSY domain-containing protein [Alkalibacterium thalassium]|uniref:Peptidase propeptide and YPEB domain-containing protein n=1 Tax=Alkalibacterium thalassium TaxID=426701 RepID=A0A1G9EBL5_9LACT|nr:PepSY domain-containing protein [Alkalibacterium thalassium]SDK73514.1 Peptidase propeptide and YPEB domain-containing protein [Alkalibacterium thalassium]
MSTSKAIRLGVLSLSASLLLAACDDNDTQDTTPVEDDTEQTGDTDAGDDTAADNTGEDDPDDTAADNTSDDETDGAADDATDSQGIQGMTFSVSLDDAIDQFYETFGSEDINISSIQFDYDDGRYLYEFEGWDGQYEYELDIDAETGEIVQQEQDDDVDSGDILDLEGIISPEEAMEAALDASGSGYVEEWGLEVEDGRTIYDIDVEGGSDQQVDAQTGDVL